MHQLLPLSPSQSLSRSRKSPVIRFLLERTGERNACTQTRLALLVAPTVSSATCTYTCTCILTYLRFSPRIPLSLSLFIFTRTPLSLRAFTNFQSAANFCAFEKCLALLSGCISRLRFPLTGTTDRTAR